MNNSFKIADLIVKSIKGTISSTEQVELDQWIKESSDNLSVFEKATDPKSQLNKLEIYQLFKKDKAWSKLESELFQAKTVQLTSRKWMLYAASILFPLLITISIFYVYDREETTTLSDIDTVVMPGSQKAVLLLSNGGSLELGKESSLAEFNEADVMIKNENDALVYSAENKRGKVKELVYNILNTPRGGGYNLELADGTKVWLNAGSSLKFPVDFTDSTRKVYLVGEAYFDVIHNGKSFIVSVDKMDVRVLGTSFNISAYSDESEIKTTLVEGKVLVQISDSSTTSLISKILTPNNQAIVSKTYSDIDIAKVNTSHYTSWINGKLEFENEDLDQVMKTLARWYDFNYEFENPEAMNYHFSARINNTENISTILEMLEMTTNVKFNIKENTIVIN